MTDFLGIKVDIGDKIAFTMPKYQHILIGIIESLTPKGISCNWNSVYWLNLTENSKIIPVPKHHQNCRYTISRLRHQFVKIQYNEGQ